jgi:hypothetical protein
MYLAAANDDREAEAGDVVVHAAQVDARCLSSRPGVALIQDYGSRWI